MSQNNANIPNKYSFQDLIVDFEGWDFSQYDSPQKKQTSSLQLNSHEKIPILKSHNPGPEAIAWQLIIIILIIFAVRFLWLVVKKFLFSSREMQPKEYVDTGKFSQGEYEQQIPEREKAKHQSIDVEDAKQVINAKSIILCPSCSQKILVPYGKWLQVICPTCNKKFEVKP